MNISSRFKTALAVWVCSVFVSVNVSANEPRIVAVGGALTEIIFALGKEDRLVGVDTTSLWPEAATKLPQVGYMRNLSAEGILSLTPTLVLTTQSAGPGVVIEQIRQAGIEIKTVNEEPSADGVIAKIREIADWLNATEQGEQLAKQVRNDFERVERFTAELSRRPKVLFILTHSRGAPIVAGIGTPADAMIRIAGGDNAMQSLEGFKPTSSEALIGAAPDVIVMTDMAIEALGGSERLFELPGFNATPAAKLRNVLTLDALSLLGFGPRSGQAAWDLARQLHPHNTVASER